MHKNIKNLSGGSRRSGFLLPDGLDHRDVDSAQLAVVLGIGFDLVRDLLTLFQLLKALTLDGGEMDEHVAAAVIVGDEAITLFSVEPFNSSVQHLAYLLGNLHRKKTAQTGSRLCGGK